MADTSPYRPVDDDARALAAHLIDTAPFAALATRAPDGTPTVSRIAFAACDGAALSLISTLSEHTKALLDDLVCALLLGEPEDRGDPLTHPRLTLHARAEFLDRTAPQTAALRKTWLSKRPKTKLYIDFADFSLVRFRAAPSLLNGGFGKAFRLDPSDLPIT